VQPVQRRQGSGVVLQVGDKLPIACKHHGHSSSRPGRDRHAWASCYMVLHRGTNADHPLLEARRGRLNGAARGSVPIAAGRPALLEPPVVDRLRDA
jgi:hypothetical protein